MGEIQAPKVFKSSTRDSMNATNRLIQIKPATIIAVKVHRNATIGLQMMGWSRTATLTKFNTELGRRPC